MPIKRYLESYAEPECHLVLCQAHYSHVLVIPAYDESPDFLSRLQQVDSDNKFLLILVVNEPDNARDCPANILLEQHIKEHYTSQWVQREGFLASFAGDTFDILLVRRFGKNKPIPRKQGVGLARKIGADIACKLISEKCIQSPWIFSSDADAILPENYFNAAKNTQTAALVFNFQHIGPDNTPLTLPFQLYEHSLHYYVNGLKWAGSPYAFHTIGSCLAVHSQHYAMVRGFPKRAGGEDFYLLNKLRKTGTVVSVDKPCLRLLARESERVPFGTGPATRKISQLEKPAEQFLFYQPLIFQYLRCWLSCIKQFPDMFQRQSSIDDCLTALIQHTCNIDKRLNHQHLLITLNKMGSQKALQHALQHSKNNSTFEQHMMHWFDGFKTLKFVHHLRDHHLPSLPWQEVVKLNPPFSSSLTD